MRKSTIGGLIAIALSALLFVLFLFTDSGRSVRDVGDRQPERGPRVADRPAPPAPLEKPTETEAELLEARGLGLATSGAQRKPAEGDDSSLPQPTRPKQDASKLQSTVIQEKRQIRTRKKPRSENKAEISNNSVRRDPRVASAVELETALDSEVFGDAREAPTLPEEDANEATRARLTKDLVTSRRRTPPTPAEAQQLAKLSERLRERKQPRTIAPEPPPPAEPELQGFENKVQEQEVAPVAGMTSTADEPTSTFSVDVDTGSYTLARARLRGGYPPKPEHVRIEEFLNYFAYDYPQPVEGEFAVHFEAAPDPFEPATRHLLRIGVQGKSVPDDARPPAHLTFVIDVSGSMFGPDGVGLVIEALDLVARNLRPDDTVAVVTFARDARVAMWPAGAGQRDVIAEVVARLEAGGSSALDEGLKLGYEVASTHFYAGHVNRVVLIGDGRANVGEVDPDAILASVAAGVEDGVMLSTIGFGAKSFNDSMMERLADRGNGSYFFVDSYREAQQVFQDRLCGTLYAIAQDVKIQVEFNPQTVQQYRLVGYENRKLTNEQFRDDSVDAGEIGAGHQVTALYELVLSSEPDTTVASVSVRYKKPGESRASEVNYQLFTNELRPDVRAASADFKFAAAAALFARVVRRDVPGGKDRLSLIAEIAGEGITRREDQPDRVEFVELVANAAPFFADR